MNNTIKFLIATLTLSVAFPILAHVSPEHVIGYSHETSPIWKILITFMFISGLIAVTAYLSKNFLVNTK